MALTHTPLTMLLQHNQQHQQLQQQLCLYLLHMLILGWLQVQQQQQRSSWACRVAC
jgi:hypothetical protein